MEDDGQMSRGKEALEGVIATVAVVAIFMWVPVASVLWVVSFWRPEVKDFAVWMLGIAGILATAGALTFMAQQVTEGPDA